MRVVNLVENTKGSKGCLFEHGLSFYIETGGHKLLVDTGATDLFMKNAQILGVDLSQVQKLVLSHGHYDHSGGILSFAQINSKADIYMQRTAIGEYYHKEENEERYIGIDRDIPTLPQVKFLNGNAKLADGVTVFSDVKGRKLWPDGNTVLKEKRDGEFVQDEFAHEQYLVLEENGKRVLISGCAHNGILNILERFEELYTGVPDAVVSGFHMKKKNGYTQEDYELIAQVAKELKKIPTMFYTGHCTGEEPYLLMKEIMGAQLTYIHSGDEIIL